jgi:tetratricopeptide (TPR) repeat protein
MACSPENHERLVRLAQGRLPGAEADAILEHALGCASCGEELDFLGDLTRAVELEAAAARRPAGAWRRPWIRFTAAAAALIAALVAGWLSFGERPPSLASLADIAPFAFVEGTLRGGGGEERAARFAAAMAAYNGRDLAAAAALLGSLAAEDPEDHKLHLYLGVSLLQLGRVAEAASALARAAGAEGLLGERARWYLAMTHLLREDAAAARRSLEEIRDAGGAYRRNAERTLEALAAAEGGP